MNGLVRLRLLLGWLLLASGLAALTPAVLAADELNYAGLVVRHGDGSLTYAYVAFGEESITGAELLERTGIPIVTVPFGGLGVGVCSIEGEGCGAGECRRRVCQGPGNESPFWQYFRQVAPGEWQPLTLGASSTTVHDGDVDGWSWTPEEPKLPAVTLPEVARRAGVPEEDASPVAGAVPTAAVRSVSPTGAIIEAGDDGDDQGPLVYAGAAVILAALGAASFLAIRRSRATGGVP